jgi:hypothetical protein
MTQASAGGSPESRLRRHKQDQVTAFAEGDGKKREDGSRRRPLLREVLRVLGLSSCLCALPLMDGMTGCAAGRYNQSGDQRIEDSRTAERVREALAAGGDYRYDGVKVTTGDGVVRLSGFVGTRDQRNSAGEITGKVPGVKDVVNDLTVKE